MSQFAPTEKFKFWCQKVLPLVYDDSLSYYELLNKVVNFINNLVEISNSMGEQINKNTTDIAALQQQFQKFMESGFNDYYAAQVEKWINDNLTFIYTHTVKQIYFGLTDDGYFVAYIPESWDDITFSTIMSCDPEMYGRLVLSY